jgi:hypothetical protein
VGRIAELLLLDRPKQRNWRFLAVQLFPFADPTGVGGFLDVQSAVYAALPAGATV